MSFGQLEDLGPVIVLVPPDFKINKLNAADPMAFIQFSAALHAKLLDFDGQLKYLPPGWTVTEVMPDPVVDPVGYAQRLVRNNRYNYVGDEPSKAAMEALSARIALRVTFDNVNPPVVGAVAPPNYSNTDVNILTTLQTSVQMETKKAENEVIHMGGLIAWVRECSSPALIVNLDTLNQSDRDPIPYSKNMIYRLYAIYLEGVCKGDNTSFRELILERLARVGLSTNFQEALMVIDQINYWYRIILSFDRTHPSLEHPPTVRTLVLMLLFRFPNVDPMNRLRKLLIKMTDNPLYVYDWSAVQALLRREVGLSHPQGPSRLLSSGAIVSHASSAGTYFVPHSQVSHASMAGQYFVPHSQVSHASSAGASFVPHSQFSHASNAGPSFVPHPEVASLQLQLQEAHQMLAASKSQGFYGTIADAPVGSPQPIVGHQYPFNAGYGLHPPSPAPPSNLCHSYPFCKFERCNFSHLTDGHLDNEMDVVQNMSLAEICVLNPPLARNEPFRPRASPVLLAEYNRLMTQRSSSLGKRKGL